MSNKQNPNDPDSLSLSKKGEPPAPGGEKRPDFSNVVSGSDTVPASGGTRPDFSNVVSAADTVSADAPPTQTYTVQKGDTLSHIAQRHYGKASKWRAIFEANRDQLDDPDRIRPGQVLKLPPAEA